MAINFLLDNKDKLKKSIVIACSDGMSSALDINRNKLSDYYKLPGSNEQGRITYLMDKNNMSNLGEHVGFSIPRSWLVESINDIADVEYPCISKPLISKDGSKNDIVICNNYEELANIIANGSSKRYQVQEFIDKDFEYQLIGLSLNEGKEVIIPGYSKCIRPCPGTNTGFLYYDSLDNIKTQVNQCKEFLYKTGYSGLFSIEFLRDKKGIDYFMEINFRNDGNSICVTESGTNLPYIWFLANTGGSYMSEISNSTFKSVYAMPEFPDFLYFVCTRKISVLKWIKDVISTDVFMVFHKYDIKPFIFQLMIYIQVLTRMVFEKVRKYFK